MAPARLTSWVCAAALTCAVLPGVAAAATPFSRCAGAKELQCAVIRAPLDPSGATAGTISLAAARLPAPSPATPPVAVVALAGGPGQAALPLTADFADALAPALATRDLIVFDQRGTGLSSPLACRALERPSKSLSATVRRCASELGPGRRYFTTAQSVADIDAIRQAGGYDKLVLFGVSYGTKVALAYAAAHPDHTQALVLDSTVTPQGPDALARSSLQAVPRVIGQDLCGDGACAAITRDPIGDIRSLARRLASHPVSGAVYSPSGKRYTGHLSAGGLVAILLAGDLNPTLRAEFPGSVRAALTGDVKPILRLSARSAGLANSARFQAFEADNDALYFDTTCEENTTLPWTRGAAQSQRRRELSAAIAALPPGTTSIFPPSVVRAGIPDLCLGWLVAGPPPAPPGPLPNVPALLLAGQSDLRTPLEDAHAVAKALPLAQVVEVPHSGHSVLGSDPGICAQRAVAAFFALTTPPACPAIENPYSPTPRPPLSLSRVATAPRYSGRIGRTLTALLDTLTDGRRQVIGEALALGATPVGAGGLRGGAVRVTRGGLNFHDYEYVPGVKVTGHFRTSGTSSLRITGRSAAHGNVRITRGGTMTGTLAGKHIRISVVRARAASRNAAELPSLAEAVARGRLIAGGR